MNQVLALIVLFAAAGAQAADHSYRCFSYVSTYDEKTVLVVKLNERTAVGKAVSENGVQFEVNDRIDPTYKPRTRKDWVRYGRHFYVEEALLKGGYRLNDGGLGGKVQWETQAEGGFFQYKFICKRQPR